MFYLGVDPGFKNLGAAITKVNPDGKLELVASKVFNPSKKPLEEFPADLFSWLKSVGIDSPRYQIRGSGLERYVAYKGVMSSDSENILMIIGMLRSYIHENTGTIPNMYRAIDWKKDLAKALFKKGFRNPSDSLDKIFSIAAASACVTNLSQKDIETDHEADAICISAVPFLCGTPTKTKT